MAIVDHLEKLPYFIAIAETGSFRKASERLRIAQPSLSKAISVLERATGTLLLERHRGGARLTRDGEALVTTAREVLRAAARFQGSVATPMANRNRQLRIATHELLVPLIADNIGKYAGELDVRLQTNPSVGRLLDMVEDFAADVAIVAASPPRKSLHFAMLFEDSYAFFCSATFFAHNLGGARKPLKLADVKELPLILAPQVLAGPRETLIEHLARRGFDLPPKHVVGSIESVATLAAAGLGVGLLPSRVKTLVKGGPEHKEVKVRLPQGMPLGHHHFSFCCRSAVWEHDELVRDLFEQIRRACTGSIAI